MFLRLHVGPLHGHLFRRPWRWHWAWYRLAGGPLVDATHQPIADYIVGRGFQTPLLCGQVAWHFRLLKGALCRTSSRS